eukprot:scaffold918_cov99-Isochrysis_galbana.AAC.5
MRRTASRQPWDQYSGGSLAHHPCRRPCRPCRRPLSRAWADHRLCQPAACSSCHCPCPSAASSQRRWASLCPCLPTPRREAGPLPAGFREPRALHVACRPAGSRACASPRPTGPVSDRRHRACGQPRRRFQCRVCDFVGGWRAVARLGGARLAHIAPHTHTTHHTHTHSTASHHTSHHRVTLFLA